MPEIGRQRSKMAILLKYQQAACLIVIACGVAFVHTSIGPHEAVSSTSKMEENNQKNSTADESNGASALPDQVDLVNLEQNFVEELLTDNRVYPTIMTSNLNYYTISGTYEFYSEQIWRAFRNYADRIVSFDKGGDEITRQVQKNLTFGFPYYDKIFHGMYVNAHGFIALCNICAPRVASYHVISPLRSNAFSNASLTTIRMHQNEYSFTAQWDIATDRTNGVRDFTFQTTLFKDGTIVFVYKELPVKFKMPVNNINIGIEIPGIYFDKSGVAHNVTTIESIVFSKMDDYTIENGSLIVIRPRSGCAKTTNCHDCTQLNPSFPSPSQCTWCSSVAWCFNNSEINQRWYQDNHCEHSSTVLHTLCEDKDKNNHWPQSTDKPSTSKPNKTWMVTDNEGVQTEDSFRNKLIIYILIAVFCLTVILLCFWKTRLCMWWRVDDPRNQGFETVSNELELNEFNAQEVQQSTEEVAPLIDEIAESFLGAD